MLSRILPRQVDNTYRGHRLGLRLFGLLVSIKVAMSLSCIFKGYSIASSADGIPLDTFTAGAAQTVVSLSAIWGLSHLIVALLCAVVLSRYRSMIPFMFALLVLEQLSRRLILQFLPIVRSRTPAGFHVNLALVTVVAEAHHQRASRPSQVIRGVGQAWW